MLKCKSHSYLCCLWLGSLLLLPVSLFISFLYHPCGKSADWYCGLKLCHVCFCATNGEKTSDEWRETAGCSCSWSWAASEGKSDLHCLKVNANLNEELPSGWEMCFNFLSLKQKSHGNKARHHLLQSNMLLQSLKGVKSFTTWRI